MTDLLLQIGVSNLLVALVLAVAAWAVHARGKWPVVAHLLWVLVLIKLVTPPIMTVPMVPIPGAAASAPAPVNDGFSMDAASAAMLLGVEGATPDLPDPAAMGITTEKLVEAGKTGLIALWLLGSVCILAWSLVRIIRFHRLLGVASKPAPGDVQRQAQQLAQRLGLRSVPLICTTSAQISPMVWWAGGRVRIIIPDSLVREIDMMQLRWILAHELAHVRRRDHAVRWLEWLACVCFWWNPIAWWARRNLRINEEVCCDALVLDTLRPQPRVYANALINVIEFLASPAIRPPAVASEITGGGFLERRFDMIISKQRAQRTPRWVLSGILLATAGLMPLGVAYGQDVEAVSKRLKEAIAAGELSEKHAHVMLDALKRTADRANAIDRERMALDEELARAEMEFKAAINAGNVSEADAAARLTDLATQREALAAYAAQLEADANDTAAARAEAERRAATKAGRFGDAAAKAWMEAAEARGRLGSQRASAQELRNLEMVVAEIEAALKAGKISKAEAHENLEALRRKMADSKVRVSDGFREEDLGKGLSDFRKMEEDEVALEAHFARRAMAEYLRLSNENATSEADAKARLDEMRKRESEQTKKAEHESWLRAAEEAEAKRRSHETDLNSNYARQEAELRQAIAAGKISILEAAEHLKKLRAEMDVEAERAAVTRKEQANLEMAQFMSRLEEALAAGKISKEEAREALEQAKRAMEESMKRRGGGDR